MTDRCPGCGAELPDDPLGARHEYLTSSSGCWEAFGELLAREFGDPTFFAEHQLTVDTYAAQHPAGGDARQTQSLAIHLIGLCHALELGTPPGLLLRITQQLTRDRRPWPLLAPPASYPMTVVDALATTNAQDHLRVIHAWCRATPSTTTRRSIRRCGRRASPTTSARNP